MMQKFPANVICPGALGERGRGAPRARVSRRSVPWPAATMFNGTERTVIGLLRRHQSSVTAALSQRQRRVTASSSDRIGGGGSTPGSRAAIFS